MVCHNCEELAHFFEKRPVTLVVVLHTSEESIFSSSALE